MCVMSDDLVSEPAPEGRHLEFQMLWQRVCAVVEVFKQNLNSVQPGNGH